MILITNIPRVRDPEETILCPRVMAANAFSPVTFFSDVVFLKFYSSKRPSERIKLCKKNYRSPTSFGRKQSFLTPHK